VIDSLSLFIIIHILSKMMIINKRRQTLLQILLVMAVMGLIAYAFYPALPPSTRILADNWYDESKLPSLESHARQEAAALAAISQKNAANVAMTNPNRVKAAFVILARNSDLQGIRYSIRQMEDRFNRHFNYPYVFLNEEYFTDEFKQKTSDLTKAQTFYGKIESDMWGYPDYINQTYAAECRQSMHDRRIIYGGSESYRHMCR
jgi:hypothetical protein